MTNNNSATSGGVQLPRGFFTVSTFGTLGGCAIVTWVVTSVLSGIFGIDRKITGLIVSMAVVYAGLFLSKERRKAQYVVAFFNGFLIYATVVGGTSFLPYINPKTAGVVQEKKANIRTALTEPWVPDQNLVAATKELLKIENEQTKALTEARNEIEATRLVLAETPVLSSTERNEFLRRLSRTEAALTVTPKIDSLERVGVKLRHH